MLYVTYTLIPRLIFLLKYWYQKLAIKSHGKC